MGTDRVLERRRAVALARHYREFEGLSIRQIADRLGRSPATIKAYFYDPTGEKARAVKARYVGVCRGCGAYTRLRNGKGTPTPNCKACHPGAIEGRWTRERVLDAMLRWSTRYGRLPSSYDWSSTHARRRGGEPLEQLSTDDWPSAGVVTAVYGSWKTGCRRPPLMATAPGIRNGRQLGTFAAAPPGQVVQGQATRDRTAAAAPSTRLGPNRRRPVLVDAALALAESAARLRAEIPESGTGACGHVAR
jgi:AcrR family transcriptional regulator